MTNYHIMKIGVLDDTRAYKVVDEFVEAETPEQAVEKYRKRTSGEYNYSNLKRTNRWHKSDYTAVPSNHIHHIKKVSGDV